MPTDKNKPDTATADSSVRLLEVANRDLWQTPLISSDGCACGHVIRQLVEPSMCTIRYIIVYDHAHDRHIPVPATTIRDITSDGVFCQAQADSLRALPSLTYPFPRIIEEEVHRLLAIPPYWLEEANTRPTQ
ncbi:MAG: hypothetical protein GX316_08795 [Firmicutes bacterium]|nr:hypothetical protein [Bacillota bacterium]